MKTFIVALLAMFFSSSINVFWKGVFINDQFLTEALEYDANVGDTAIVKLFLQDVDLPVGCGLMVPVVKKDGVPITSSFFINIIPYQSSCWMEFDSPPLQHGVYEFIIMDRGDGTTITPVTINVLP